ncbi:MAG: hypothetical protein SWQ30_08650 [Thermodesulfobacteriota bacterium]|nr:hypothetical protein [Thermodesulfobacteriota bacterium]
MRRLKLFSILLIATMSAVTGGRSVLMASSGTSHATHFVSGKGPGLPVDETGCDVCHADGRLQCQGAPVFADGEYLADTGVCDACHSPGGAYDGVAHGILGAKANWDDGVYDGNTLQTGKEQWCLGCHDDDPDTPGTNESAVIDTVYAPGIAGNNISYGFYASGHGRSASVQCLDCHDASVAHTDGEARTYAFNWDSDPAQSGVAYAQGYRLRYIDGEVPLMIPASYGTTFGYNALVMKETAFRLCFDCHDKDKVFDDTPGDGIDSNFKASSPNPPRNHSYEWGSGADVNEHVNHIMNYTMECWDSDWDTGTNGPGPGSGTDSMTACSVCHNVHGAAGAEGSTNEAMIRDGTLAGRPGGYGFSYVLEDLGNGGYPWVTSHGATQSASVGSIFRYNTEVNNMCGGSMCHANPTPPPASSYDASGSSWGTYLEYYRPWASFGTP